MKSLDITALLVNNQAGRRLNLPLRYVDNFADETHRRRSVLTAAQIDPASLSRRRAQQNDPGPAFATRQRSSAPIRFAEGASGTEHYGTFVSQGIGCRLSPALRFTFVRMLPAWSP